MSSIAAGTSAGTALVSTGDTSGALQLQVNGTTPSVTLAANGSIGVGSTPAYGTSGQVLTSAGSAAAPTWATLSAAVGDHEVYVTTGNGYGSTNTKIERFSVTQRNVGTAITYADSASLGSTFTINEAGIYAMEYSGYTSSTDSTIGISVNSTQLTTGIKSITAANRLCIAGNNASQLGQIFVSTTALLAATNVVRPHVNNAGSNADVATWFKIRKIGVAV